MSGAKKRKCLIVMNGGSTKGQSNRFCGFTDPPLAPQGREAVMNLRERLLGQDGQSSLEIRLPRIWYVSDRRRAVETFEILTAGMPAPVVRLTEQLREMNFGDFENLTWDELPADFQREYELYLKNPVGLKFPGGESFLKMCERVSIGALDILSYKDDDSDIGVVGHQGSLRLWFMMHADIPPERFFEETPELADSRWIDIDVTHVANWRRKYLANLKK